jgi:hypothetical protein
MEPKTNRVLLPKHIYLDFIVKYAEQNPDLQVVRLKGKMAMPYELRKGSTTVLTYDRWFNTMSTYFFKARERIIVGDRLSLGSLGWLHGKRIERNFRNKALNWKQTLAQPKVFDPAKGKMVPVRKVYFTDPEYCRIGWSNRKKSTEYRFVPTNSSKQRKGFKEQFSLALMANPTLKFRYTYHPYSS